jgi:microcompartment protein CcmK/EutM
MGDMVLVIDEGNAARKILGDSTAPVRTVIAAIVDRVDQGNVKPEKKA